MEQRGSTSFELAASRQIEVVRGPVSALHGGSLNGVVNVVSRTGRDSPGISVRALHGAFGFQKYYAQAGAVFASRRGSAFAASSYTSADGYRAHSDGDMLRAQVAFDYVAGPATRIAIEANGSRLDSRLPGSLNQPQFDEAKFRPPAVPPRRYGDPEAAPRSTLSLVLPAASYLNGAIIPVDGGMMAQNT